MIEHIPFEFAIPILTGWELGYDCEDEHVTERGIWIDEWSYDKNTRILRYKLSSALRNKNGDHGFYSRHKVTILGLQPITGRLTKERSPDLVPFSPSGSTAAAFLIALATGGVHAPARNSIQVFTQYYYSTIECT